MNGINAPWSVGTHDGYMVDEDPVAVLDAKGNFVACNTTFYPTALKQEHAHLISAAPELLLALQELLHAYSKPDERLCCDGRDCGCRGSTVHQQAEHYARLAIAKAEGR